MTSHPIPNTFDRIDRNLRVTIIMALINLVLVSFTLGLLVGRDLH